MIKWSLVKFIAQTLWDRILGRRRQMLKVGTEAPDFLVNDHNGNRVTLKDLRGQKVILWFFPKADTPGCTMEGQGFRDAFDQFKEKNTVILGVSLDNEADNKAFAEKFNFPYPLLCDVGREISLAYQAIKSKDDQYASRITYVIDENGKIAEAIDQVDTKNHANDLCSRI
ncbi:Alkyl hydroperoxide reductase/ Thiol specific antioxidant/ Mal allergen [Nitrospina gracilis 3/211]|uniref:thioredoxin-dependent peroxiredoxin n=2 Tax=Nitrospinaceae TaxID=407032 RepID=M1YYS1_NITG3|nr:Alkyl hydroperoxide reductase/ Thiol specific antioxidant/ Mal allergen [Nitrospina gracilis 3/211]